MEEVIENGTHYDRYVSLQDIWEELMKMASHHGALELWWNLLQMGRTNVTNVLKSASRENGHESFMEAAIALGADINEPIYDSWFNTNCTPICSAKSGIHLLINRGADIYCVDDHGKTALHNAGCPEAVVALLSRGLDVNVRDKYGRTPLFYVKDVDTMKALINYGAALDAKDSWGSTALHVPTLYAESATNNIFSVIDMDNMGARLSFLLSAGASVTAQDNDGDTPLHKALRDEHTCQTFISALQMSLPHTSCSQLLTVANNRGETVLHVAAKESTSSAMEFLVDRAVPLFPSALNMKDEHGQTPLHRATACGSLTKAKTLLAAGANPDEQDNYGTTPLHVAAHRTLSDIANALVARGADVNVQGRYGSTALHIAVAHDNDETMISLLSAPTISVNIRDNEGQTVLHYATLHNVRMKTVQSLLEHGADKSVVDNKGHDAAHYATKTTVKHALTMRKRKRE